MRGQASKHTCKAQVVAAVPQKVKAAKQLARRGGGGRPELLPALTWGCCTLLPWGGWPVCWRLALLLGDGMLG